MKIYRVLFEFLTCLTIIDMGAFNCCWLVAEKIVENKLGNRVYVSWFSYIFAKKRDRYKLNHQQTNRKKISHHWSTSCSWCTCQIWGIVCVRFWLVAEKIVENKLGNPDYFSWFSLIFETGIVTNHPKTNRKKISHHWSTSCSWSTLSNF